MAAAARASEKAFGVGWQLQTAESADAWSDVAVVRVRTDGESREAEKSTGRAVVGLADAHNGGQSAGLVDMVEDIHTCPEEAVGEVESRYFDRADRDPMEMRRRPENSIVACDTWEGMADSNVRPP